MAKARHGFAGELRGIQGEVDSHVTTILELAKQGEKTPTAPAANSASPIGHAISEASRTDHGNPRENRPQVPRTLLQNVTTRLTSQTNDLLTEAALRQRLKKTTPATRQEIMEQAVHEWLVRHGYDSTQD
jgi:hypothetical protein